MWDLSSPTRGWNPGPLQWKHSLNHWTTREVPGMVLTGRKRGTANGSKVAVEVVTASKRGRTQEVSGIRGIKEKGAGG